MRNHFELQTTDPSSSARRGRIATPHGHIETPIFMPVGTQATVKGLTPKQLHELEAQIILGNTYHLMLRPGSELIRDCGGLHRFMGWSGPILTDSGGFQVFSLAALRKITESGIEFRSHIDGRPVFLSPRSAVQIQMDLNSDIAMVLDECPPPEAAENDLQDAVERTLRWAAECRAFALANGLEERGNQLFGIVQGGRNTALRKHCAEGLAELGFSGYAIGGVSVGEAEEEMMEQVAATAPNLPPERPRYVMGVGNPTQLLKMISLGIDMFDCVIPTREARHGIAYTESGRMNMKNSRFASDQGPVSRQCRHYCCQHFSRAYIRHLFNAGEILGSVLLSIHNIGFFLDLMSAARVSIESGCYTQWSTSWLETYHPTDDKGITAEPM